MMDPPRSSRSATAGNRSSSAGRPRQSQKNFSPSSTGNGSGASGWTSASLFSLRGRKSTSSRVQQLGGRSIATEEDNHTRGASSRAGQVRGSTVFVEDTRAVSSVSCHEVTDAGNIEAWRFLVFTSTGKGASGEALLRSSRWSLVTVGWHPGCHHQQGSHWLR